MSKFEKLIDRVIPNIVPPTPSLGMGAPNKDLILTCINDTMTGADYKCYPVECPSCGENHVGYILDPEYNIQLGKDKDIPLALIFTHLPAIFKAKGTYKSDSILLTHPHTTGGAHEVTCTCGVPYHFFEGKFGGVVCPMGSVQVQIKVPKNRVTYITNIPHGYETETKTTA